jgi:glycosyltransferase involved in cell wall biosynthesis
MKILLINDSPTDIGGGTEQHVRALSEELRKMKHSVHILCSQKRGKSLKYKNWEWRIPFFNNPLLRKNLFSNFRDIRRSNCFLKKIIDDFQPDIIHVHNMLNPFVLRLLRKSMPIVKSIHDCRPFCSKPPPIVASRLIGNSNIFCNRVFGAGCWQRCYWSKIHDNGSISDLLYSWSFFIRNLLALHEVIKCEKIIVYSEYLRKLALRKIIKEKIELIYHFTDYNVINTMQRVFPMEKTILFVGRLSTEKGIFILLKAIKKVPHKFKTIIVGHGPMKEQVQNKIRQINGKKIQLINNLNHTALKEIYQLVNFVVFPSLGSEGCPLVGIEAMAHGRPVVGFDVGGVNEWLIDGKTGFLVSRGSTSMFANRISTLLKNENLAKKMGNNGVELIKSKFRKDVHVEKLLEIYKEAINNRK